MVVVDNDILHKGSGFGLLEEIINAIPAQIHEVCILRAAKFIVSDKLSKAQFMDALTLFQKILQKVQIIEPTEAEARFAAQLEYEAQRANLNIDSGESQLCAVVIIRSYSYLVTGDKRAIKSLELLLSSCGSITKLAGKVLCLEQLMLRIIQKTDVDMVRYRICERPSLDKTLSICFSCSSPEVGPESWQRCLLSYVQEAQRGAPTILAN